MTEEPSRDAPAGTVSRTVRLIAALADRSSAAGINDLVAAVGLPASTVHRLLKLLMDEGVVERGPAAHEYRVGPELYRIASATLSNVGFTQVVQPVINELADHFDETVLYGQYLPSGKALAFLARADGRSLLQYRIDLNRPGSLVWGSSGKAVLAFLEPREIEAVYEYEKTLPGGGRSVMGDREIPPFDELLSTLGRIREAGFASSEAEKLPEARGIAVPVFGPRAVVGSITLTYPRERAPHSDPAVIAARLRTAAGEIGRLLGARGR